ncbi:tetratricopeptide repeat protein [Paraglaciecola aquimarina]|uniref:Tetratricopeptide repeat protein n=1 Tax=Paraglaciecola aquimarina TaxID=1235557 RepID=A0ABU3SX05_9ALTE|nr:tetratricopeptide repeat protein [Paraglaciecola aquimarina]MDU0354530.1 tetratricopeptide repeat protein [Paraglaciecola aquimarina]
MQSFRNYIIAFILIFTPILAIADSDSHYEKALQAYMNKDFNESYVHLKNALKDNPSDLAAKILMGEMLLINGYFNEAVTELEEALDMGADANLVLKPYGKSLILTQNYEQILRLGFDNLSNNNKFELHLLKATAYASLNDPLNGEKSYLLAYALKPNNIRTLNSLTTLYLKQEKLSQSAQYLALSLKVDDQHPSTWRLKGMLEKQQKNNSQALMSFEKAYQLDPTDPFMLRAYADSLWEAKETAKAENIIDQILEQTPDDAYALLLKSQILSVTDKTEEAQQLLNKLAQDLSLIDAQSASSNISLRFASGMTAYLTKNYEQALSDMIYYTNNSSLEIHTLGILADTYIKLKQERSALKLLESNEDLVIQNLNISLQLCDLYLRSNRAFKCESLSDTLREKYPNHPKIDFVKAKTLVARGKITQAIAILESIQDPAFQNQKKLAIAHLYFQSENYQDAYQIAQALLIDLPENIDILNLNVALLIKKQDWSAAQKLLNRIFSIQADYGPALYNQANLYGALHKYADAISIMANLEDTSALQAGSYLLYADLLISSGDLSTAIDKLKHAAKLNKESTPIIDKLIGLYIRTERYQEALREVEKYAKVTRSDEKYVLTKAELIYKLGKVEEAKHLLNQLREQWANQPQKLMQLSNVQQKTKDLQGVETTLLKVLSLEKNKHLAALVQLSTLYIDTYRVVQAQKHLTLANNYYPNTTGSVSHPS